MKLRTKASPAPAPARDGSRHLIPFTRRLKANSYRLLESRMVFDGAAVDTAATLAEAATPAPAAEPAQPAPAHDLVDLLQAAAAAPVAPAAAGATIVFIDGAVRDAGLIASAVPSGAEVIFLDARRDGVEQMAAALAGRHDIDAIHIVSHGSEGVLNLGTTRLDTAGMLGGHRDELATIGGALSANGDILIYGCDFSHGAKGLEAVTLLGSLTGADIAASSDDTGSAAHGGNWALETHFGDIDELCAEVGDGVNR